MHSNEKITLPIVIKIGGPNLGPSYAARLRNPGLPWIALAIAALEKERIILETTVASPRLTKFRE
jgi:hypothetical protein